MARMWCATSWAGSIVALVVGVASAADDAKLAARLDPLVGAHRGQVAVAVRHLRSGATYAHRADEPMPTASLIKFPLMAAAYDAVDRGELALDARVRLREEDKVPGSGILTSHFSAGAEFSLRDAIRLMIVYSDNTATNLVIGQAGLERTSGRMEALGCGETKLHSQVFRRETSIFPERSQRFGLGSTTAQEMVRLLQLLDEEQLASAESCRAMRDHLLACDDRTKLARNLPTSTRLAHKTGALSAVRTDAGLLETSSGPVAICVLTAENEDRSWGGENAADVLCGKIGLAVLRHFQRDGEASQAASDELALGANGPAVESLQRTLNARLQPSPELSVDGDFGPQTESAVLRFQRERGLPESGRVGAPFWKKLGPVVDESPAPPPEVVNAEPIERASADRLEGPPLVTAKAWIVMDERTGTPLGALDANEALHPASTTKIMTAHLVDRWIERSPEALDELVTFSERADQTPGSTSALRAGERITVGELMYGLLLPSGNDAAVALAEHFGARLAETPEADPLDAFVQAMNREARALGMERTTYANPHGLTADGHRSTAHDLARLAAAAMRSARFRAWVATARHGCVVEGPGGYQRNVAWTNTNRLLAIEGFDGVKTGTTDAAGACLVSRGARDGRSLIVVVLGSTSGDARYIDTRNLFRWAWSLPGN